MGYKYILCGIVINNDIIFKLQNSINIITLKSANKIIITDIFNLFLIEEIIRNILYLSEFDKSQIKGQDIYLGPEGTDIKIIY